MKRGGRANRRLIEIIGDGVTVPWVAERLGMRERTVRRMADHLASEGAVTREGDLIKRRDR